MSNVFDMFRLVSQRWLKDREDRTQWVDDEPEIAEVRFRANIAAADLERKVTKARAFLHRGQLVLLVCEPMPRSREATMRDLIWEAARTLADVAMFQQIPTSDRSAAMLLGPIAKE
ncbi:MAG: hypothetical protein KDC98_09480 [Planctomycetes bacterium]|nr:hypothetical protein [Planctomycetota bacterium]